MDDKVQSVYAMVRKCLSISVGPRQSINAWALMPVPPRVYLMIMFCLTFRCFDSPILMSQTIRFIFQTRLYRLLDFLCLFCCLSFHRNGERNFSRREEGVKNDKFSLTFAREWTANFYIGIMVNFNISWGGGEAGIESTNCLGLKEKYIISLTPYPQIASA